MDILSHIQFEDPNKGNGVIKATIHKTGKLGFSSAAQDFMNINEKTYFRIGFNDTDESDTNIYFVPTDQANQSFKVAKAGDYYYVNLKYIFDKRGIDYSVDTVIYDIKRQSANEVEFFVLTKRK